MKRPCKAPLYGLLQAVSLETRRGPPVFDASPAWLDAIPGALTICDEHGVVLEMNEAAAHSFAKDGGRALIGRNLLDCHPEPARSKLHGLLATGATNVYTIEKDGQKRLIYQAPWHRDGKFAGLVELALDLPAQLPHFVRAAS